MMPSEPAGLISNVTEARSRNLEKLADQWEAWQAGALYQQRPWWLRRLLVRRFFHRLGSTDTKALFLVIDKREAERDTHDQHAVRNHARVDAAA
jgi:hypothetical protein